MPYGDKKSYGFFKMKYQGNPSAFPFKSPMKDKGGTSEAKTHKKFSSLETPSVPETKTKTPKLGETKTKKPFSKESKMAKLLQEYHKKGKEPRKSWLAGM